MKNEPNKAMVPTPVNVTIPADAGSRAIYLRGTSLTLGKQNMKIIKLILLLGLLVLPGICSAKSTPDDLKAIAVDALVIFSTNYSNHLSDLERILQSEGLALSPKDRERSLALVAKLKKDLVQHLDTVGTVSKSTQFYKPNELMFQAFGMHVIASQSAYSALIVEQIILESVNDAEWKRNFKKAKAAVHGKLMDVQERAFNFSSGLL